LCCDLVGADRTGRCDTIGPSEAFLDVEVVSVGTALPERADFDDFVADVEPRLRRALAAAYGAEVGREATADALAWAWQNWDRLRSMDNPAGYLWRVGQTAVRGAARRSRQELTAVVEVELEPLEAAHREPRVEPALDGALAELSPQQRAAVVLVHGYGYSLSEAAAVLGCSVSTIRNHVQRALRRLHAALEVSEVFDD
jgi:RNA polymerase sigma-70 factor (ECF subfamily)